jgi:lipid-binding SYLF domain-containing protein
LVLLASSFTAWAAVTAAEAEGEVVDAGKTLDNFVADPDMGWFRDHAKEAKGLVICSKVVRAGFIIGGSGGRCVFVAKGDKSWNGPAFYTLGTASIGFQAGVESSEVLNLVMTQKAVDSLMSKSFKFGGDATIAVGPVGAGTGKTPGADFIVYTRSKGLYGGLNLAGSSVKPTDDYNQAYYGKAASPIDIMVKGSVHNPSADAALMSKVKKLYGM